MRVRGVCGREKIIMAAAVEKKKKHSSRSDISRQDNAGQGVRTRNAFKAQQ